MILKTLGQDKGDTYMKKKRTFLKVILLLLVVVVAGAGYGFYYIQGFNKAVDTNDDSSIIITIPKGSTATAIGDVLYDNGLIHNSMYFRYMSKKLSLGSKYKAGDYKLSKSQELTDIMKVIAEGDVYLETAKVTIPEGFELRQIIDRLASNEELNLDKDTLLKIVRENDFDYRFLKDIPKSETRLEGFLFPDTYEFDLDITEEEVIHTLLRRFDSVFKDEYYSRAKELDMSVYQIVTLASIIEREAQLSEERPVISGVFYNRMGKDMRLQSCATVQYVLGERKPVLSIKDTQIDSKYNTYRYAGLTPGPIASPGESALEAALYPEDTDYLYFVARGDGGHIFNKLYKDHVNAKNKIKLNN